MDSTLILPTTVAPPTAPASRPKTKGAPREDLSFRPSSDVTLGVELELQILDRESGDLTPGAVPLLQRAAADKLPGVTAEFMQSMIEVKTDVCRNVREVQQQLLPTLRKLRIIASSLGYDLAMAGTHPFHRTSSSAVFPAERYEKIMDRLAWLAYQRVVFGLHVHVGVPSGDMALGVTNMLVQYLPHLVALSASSPFWQGVDTGLQSARTALYRMLPHSGVPRYFAKWREFRTFCQVMTDSQAIASFKDIYWDIRPRPDFGTIEFRICDMPRNLATSLGLVALIRTLVINALRLLEERPHLRRGDVRKHWIAIENKWLATRYGLAGQYIKTPAGKRRQLRQDVAELIDRVMPVAKEYGDAPFLAALQPISKFETSADRQRRIYREAGDWKAVIKDMTASFSEGLEKPATSEISFTLPAAAPQPSDVKA
jgi:carboxylate-amine ligase